MSEAEVLHAMRAIRRHLSHYPNAADTARGIHDFWVGWAEPAPLAVTEQALQRLEQAGEVERQTVRGGTELWRLPGSAGQDD